MFSSLGARPARPRSDGYLAPGSAVCAGSTSETSTFARRGGIPSRLQRGHGYRADQAQRLMASAMASVLGHVWHDEARDCSRDCWPSRIRRLGESTDRKSIQRQCKRRWSWRRMSQPRGTAREVRLRCRSHCVFRRRRADNDVAVVLLCIAPRPSAQNPICTQSNPDQPLRQRTQCCRHLLPDPELHRAVKPWRC
jgi:hypothetical protein